MREFIFKQCLKYCFRRNNHTNNNSSDCKVGAYLDISFTNNMETCKKKSLSSVKPILLFNNLLSVLSVLIREINYVSIEQRINNMLSQEALFNYSVNIGCLD